MRNAKEMVNEVKGKKFVQAFRYVEEGCWKEIDLAEIEEEDTIYDMEEVNHGNGLVALLIYLD